mgnify:CR=1 FL=1
MDYTYQDDTSSGTGVMITAISSTTKTTATVPATLGGKAVTAIGDMDIIAQETPKLTVSGKITGIDATACANLRTFYSDFATALKTVNVSGCTNLAGLSCVSNSLTSLNISNCSSLVTLICSSNNLTSLSISGCTKLKTVFCQDNPSLTTLKFSSSANIEGLICSGCALASLDVSQLTALDSLNCVGNKLTSLNISKNTNLTVVRCNDNKLTSLDISKNTKLTYLNCSNNYIADTTALEAWFDVSGHSGAINPQQNQGSTTTPATKVNLSQCTFDSIAAQTFTGYQLTPYPAVKYKGAKLKQNTDYTVAYANNIKPGTATVTITGKGNYTGTKKLTFKVNAKSISSATATVADQNYTGKALTPAPTVKMGSTTLKSGTDYTLKYSNNIKAGTATITITGKGNYAGTKTVTFKIKVKEGWVKTGNRWWYQNSDGTYPKSCSKVISGKTYRFDASGWMRTGWVKDGSYWYYHDNSGAMKTGWLKTGGKWYYLTPGNGKMKTGFFNVGSSRYYANTSGVMQTGWKKISNKWYYFNDSGAMAKSWKKVSGKWYYLDPSSGVMKTGWLVLSGKTYYLDLSSGAMKTGWQKITGWWYYFDGNGVSLRNKWISGTYWVKADGVMAINMWVDGGKYWVGADGKWVKNKKPSSSSSSNTTTATTDQQYARQIFDAYNNYRASKGLKKVTWDNECATMAYNSAKGCADKGSLIHRLGIPAGKQSQFSDILQYATWKMSANEAVQRWKDSDGHRKMMQCTTATKAGVGIYKNSKGVYYYAIVYNFSGTNANGN